jgi:translation initiation factor 5
MPPLEIATDNRSKQRKTHLKNVAAVARNIFRPEEWLVKFIAVQLSNCRNSRDSAGSYLTGHHNATKLQQLVFEFISAYVLCSSCHSPETLLRVEGKKRRKVCKLTCHSCGEDGNAAGQDERMLNLFAAQPMPPELCPMLRGDHIPVNVEKEGVISNAVEDSDVVWATDSSAEAVAARAKEQGQLEHSVQKAAGADTMSLEASLKAIDESRECMQEFLSQKKCSGDITNQVAKLQISLRVPQHDRISLFFFAAFAFDKADIDGGLVTVGALGGLVKEHARFLRGVCVGNRNDPAAQKRARERERKRLVGCIERLCGVVYPALTKVYPALLKQMYDEEVLDEALILGWAEGGAIVEDFGFDDVTAAIRTKLNEANRPFVAWLEAADEESESGSGSGSEGESESESESKEKGDGAFGATMGSS